MKKELVEKSREELLNRRKVLEEMRGENEESAMRLSEAQVEFEERAQQEKMQQDLDDQERIIRDELYGVNMALQRIESGTFGLCLNCGEEISEARLKALPWTSTCIRCASEEEESEPGGPVEIAEGEYPVTETYEGMAGRELCNAIVERLRYGGRIELEELEIQCCGRKVILSGALPSRERIELLYEIIEDTFGVHEIENNVRIDPEAWQREDRAPDTKVPERREDEPLLEGEPEESDPFTALKEGVPVDPEDKLVYEKEERTKPKKIDNGE